MPEILHEALQADRRQCGLFLLDDHWCWIGGNDTAERMLAEGWWRGRRGGRLDSPSSMTRRAWQAAQRALAEGGPPGPPIVVPVYDATGALVAFGGVHCQGAAVPGAAMPAYVLFVRPLHGGNDADIRTRLRELFELTAGEATLAAALRRHGDLQQAAIALGIAEGSARTRLQAVFEKTGTHRQSGLLRMLDALADSMG